MVWTDYHEFIAYDENALKQMTKLLLFQYAMSHTDLYQGLVLGWARVGFEAGLRLGWPVVGTGLDWG